MKVALVTLAIVAAVSAGGVSQDYLPPVGPGIDYGPGGPGVEIPSDVGVGPGVGVGVGPGVDVGVGVGVGQEYLPPVTGEVPGHVLADDGYRYKTVKRARRLRYKLRHRRY